MSFEKEKIVKSNEIKICRNGNLRCIIYIYFLTIVVEILTEV